MPITSIERPSPTPSTEILALFKELNSEGMTVVLVTHDPAIGAAAGRVIRIKDGALA